MIRALGEKFRKSDEDIFRWIVGLYDGYRFEENAQPVINPVSLGLCLEQQKFGFYWAQTAVPTFLIDILKRRPLNFRSIDLTESALGAYEPEHPTIETLLYQTGYLTIKSARVVGGDEWSPGEIVYTLGFPNREVERSFLEDFVGAYVGLEKIPASL